MGFTLYRLSFGLGVMMLASVFLEFADIVDSGSAGFCVGRVGSWEQALRGGAGVLLCLNLKKDEQQRLVPLLLGSLEGDSHRLCAGIRENQLVLLGKEVFRGAFFHASCSKCLL